MNTSVTSIHFISVMNPHESDERQMYRFRRKFIMNRQKLVLVSTHFTSTQFYLCRPTSQLQFSRGVATKVDRQLTCATFYTKVVITGNSPRFVREDQRSDEEERSSVGGFGLVPLDTFSLTTACV